MISVPNLLWAHPLVAKPITKTTRARQRTMRATLRGMDAAPQPAIVHKSSRRVPQVKYDYWNCWQTSPWYSAKFFPSCQKQWHKSFSLYFSVSYSWLCNLFIQHTIDRGIRKRREKAPQNITRALSTLYIVFMTPLKRIWTINQDIKLFVKFVCIHFPQCQVSEGIFIYRYFLHFRDFFFFVYDSYMYVMMKSNQILSAHRYTIWFS